LLLRGILGRRALPGARLDTPGVELSAGRDTKQIGSFPISTMSNHAALSCRDLVKRFGQLTAVAGLDLSVASGECYGLLGPNGAGKTTTVEIFEGLTEPTSGDVAVLGRHWSEGGRDLRLRIGVQLQEAKFPERLSVGEIMTLFRSFYTRGPRPEETLARVELTDKRDALVRTLSGGQKQRLSLACALAGDPDVLFLDEPTTGLDPTSRRGLWSIVQELKALGRTILMTTHYMEEATQLCDRVGIMHRGRLLAEGTPAELVASLGAAQVIELATNGELDTGALTALPSVVAAARIDGAWRLTVEDVARAVPPLLELLARRGLEARRLATHQATLEDVFLTHAGASLEESDVRATTD
jgi:ABC-2 type transport system ATP-binding protein